MIKIPLAFAMLGWEMCRALNLAMLNDLGSTKKEKGHMTSVADCPAAD